MREDEMMRITWEGRHGRYFRRGRPCSRQWGLCPGGGVVGRAILGRGVPGGGGLRRGLLGGRYVDGGGVIRPELLDPSAAVECDSVLAGVLVQPGDLGGGGSVTDRGTAFLDKFSNIEKSDYFLFFFGQKKTQATFFYWDNIIVQCLSYLRPAPL